jgi:putative heme-binding domain-containing protein
MNGRLSLHTWTFVLIAEALAWHSAAAAPPAPGAGSSGAKPPAEAQWIWSPAYAKDRAPAATCYFRKTFRLPEGFRGTIRITCDDRYELYVNEQLAAEGDDWRLLKTFDISEWLTSGVNVLAVKAANTEGNSAGLVARLTLIDPDGAETTLVSNGTWRTSLKEFDGWQQAGFNDERWLPARLYGPLGPTAPWANQVAGDHGPAGRFLLSADFRVEQVSEAADTGSLIAITFNEWGEILAAREEGPLLLIVDKDQDGLVETVTTYCDQVRNCQGILALNGQVFTVADGPKGPALYRLSDDDQDGTAETVAALIEFKTSVLEHGPHAPVLGPDGLIYLVLGNHSSALRAYEANSPYHHYYEGDLVSPRYEDPNGHAAGIKAPGGVVLRTNIDGSFVQVVAGGLRNPYDIAFNREGDLFTYDADMEWDVGLPWYRPTRVNHVTAGAEFGWRSGWAKWPGYYQDSLGAVLETGRGSPAGLEFYNHYQFPARYHNALFACDWSQGRIVVVRMTPGGGTYTGQSEVFLEGHPLNATDLAIGPDGWLYFSTGGRGTEGGVYRVVWTGKVPPRPELKGALQAIRQPQLQSAWARQQIATLQQSLGEEWGRQLNAIAQSAKFALPDRLRALDLMQLVGPFPSGELLLALSREASPELRAKCAWLMGIHTSPEAEARLTDLIADADPRVRRAACESIVRGGYHPPVAQLVPLLADASRAVACSARRALEQAPLEKWKDQILEAANIRVFLMGAPALLALDPPDETLDAVLTRASELIRESTGSKPSGYLSDADFVWVLRVLQLGLARGQLTRDNVPDICRQLAEEFPAQEPREREQRINRELIRLLAYLQESSIIPRLLEELRGDDRVEEKLHLAAYARFIETGWTTQQKLALVAFYERAYATEGGHSMAGYFDNIAKDFIAAFSDEERNALLARAAQWPHMAVWALAALPEHLDDAMRARLIELDESLLAVKGDEARRLGTGLVAVLARDGHETSLAYLRRQFDSSPDRREDLAMGLAQAPEEDNWPVLVRSLPVVEGVAAQEVLTKLATVDRAPETAEPLRQVILIGLKLGDSGAPLALKLLEKWADENAADPGQSWRPALAAWQQWFEDKYPDEPAPRLPEETADAGWSYAELVGYVSSGDGITGDISRGAAAFEKAQCIKCHRHGTRGEAIGPDLSTVGQRFQRKEILESIVFPSQVISDQFASKSVVTNDGLIYTGLVAPAGDDGVTVLQANGEKVAVSRDDIAETRPSRKSAMPEGLLNQLTLEEIADLLAYLSQPAKTATATAPRPITRRKF